MYNDKEKLDYEGLVTSLNDINKKVQDGSELQKEINKVNELANELTVAWTSESSKMAREKINDVNDELAKIRLELNNLISELTKYNETANIISNETKA